MSESTRNGKRYYVVWATHDEEVEKACRIGLRCGILCVCDTLEAAMAAAENDARQSVIGSYSLDGKEEIEAKVASCVTRARDSTVLVNLYGFYKIIYHVEML